MTTEGWLVILYAVVLLTLFVIASIIASDAERFHTPLSTEETRRHFHSGARSLPFFGTCWLMVLVPAGHFKPSPWEYWAQTSSVLATIVYGTMWVLCLIQGLFALGGIFVGLKYWNRWRRLPKG